MIAIILLLFILDLVRRRRLREEYSWLWLLAGIFFLLTAAWPGFSRLVAKIIGSDRATEAFTFLGFLFLVLILIQYSVRLSKITTRLKDLAQQIAILDRELMHLSEMMNGNREDFLTNQSQYEMQYKILLEQISALKEEIDQIHAKYLITLD